MNTPPERLRPFVKLPSNLAPLGYRNFALYWVGHAASKLGRALEDMGAVWLMYELTESPALLGLLGLARAVPSVVLGPIAGAISDRVDQRRLLATTQALGLVASLALAALVISGQVEYWHLYVQVGARAGIMAFDGAVREALFPRLVPRSQIAEAVTLSATAGRAAALIGPVIGGVAIAAAGEAAPFLLSAATFPVLAVAVAWMRGVRPRTAQAGSTLRGELTEGLRYTMRAPILSGLLKLQVVVEILQMNAVMITIIGRESLGVGPEGLGGLLSAPALGALIAIGGLLGIGAPAQAGRFFIVSAIAYAAALVAFALSEHYVFSYAALVLIGLLDSLLTVTRHSVMQTAAPSDMRGRVMGNMGTVTRGVSPLAETQSGALAGLLGGRLAVITTAVVLAIAALATTRNQQLWRFRRDETETEPVVSDITAS